MISISRGVFTSSKYTISKNGDEVGSIKRNTFYNTFVISYGEEQWEVKHKSFFSAQYNMLKNNEVLFTARRKYDFNGTWIVTFKEKELIWTKEGLFSRNYNLTLENLNKSLGKLTAQGFMSVAWELDFPPSVDDWFQIGLFCLSEVTSLQNKS